MLPGGDLSGFLIDIETSVFSRLYGSLLYALKSSEWLDYSKWRLSNWLETPTVHLGMHTRALHKLSLHSPDFTLKGDVTGVILVMYK